MIKTCTVCGKEFEAKDGRMLTCSVECKKERARRMYAKPKREAVCPNCGKTFQTAKDYQIYCSVDCQRFAHNERNKVRQKLLYEPRPKKKKVKPPKVPEIVACAYCGKEFEKHYGAIYCSDECKREATNQRRRESRQAEQKYEQIGYCLVCGKEYIKRSARSVRCPECVAESRKIKAKDLPYMTLVCKHCGEEFQSRYKKFYCSRRCADKEATRIRKQKEKSRKAKRAKLDENGEVIGYYDSVLDKTLAEKVNGSDYGSYQRAKILAGIEPIKLTL